MLDNPLITICMAAFNAEDHISVAVESVLAQSYSNWELIIVDDGSEDATSRVAENYLAIDKRISLIVQENQGPAFARRRAYIKGVGDYFISLDSDDWYDPHTIDLLVSDALASNADVTMADMMRFDAAANEWRSFSSDRGLIHGTVLSGGEAFDATFPWKVNGQFLTKNSIIKEITDLRNYFNGYNNDEYLTRVIALRANFVFFSRGRYFYSSNPESITSKPSPRRLEIIDTNQRLLHLAFDSRRPVDVLERVLLQSHNGIISFGSLLGYHAANRTISAASFWASLARLKSAIGAHVTFRSKLALMRSEQGTNRFAGISLFVRVSSRFARSFLSQHPIGRRLKKIVQR